MKILHVFRAPVGGLFRHVCDLAAEQSKSGHEVGLLCDAITGGETSEAVLRKLAPAMRLGVKRLPMPRMPGPADFVALKGVRRQIREAEPDITHGHGAKGGLYARLAKGGSKAVYTPHGGSLHYKWTSPAGALFLSAERALLQRTDGLIFVCAFEQRAFEEKIGKGACRRKVIHNGLREEEFAPVELAADASDILFVGELRRLKGVDVLLEAIAILHARGRRLTATIVGGGPDRAEFAELIGRLGLKDKVSMPGPMPAREAFALGRVMVVPSRAESFPYVVLEALAAGREVIASAVGGIPEILPPENLVPPADPHALAEKLQSVFDAPEEAEPRNERTREMKEAFTTAGMAEKALAFYREL